MTGHAMNTMIEVFELGVDEEVLQHLLAKRSALVRRRFFDRFTVTHLEV